MRIVDRAIATALPAVPRPIVRRFAERYMAGETLGDAIAVVKDLNARGIKATLDVLGESITHRWEAEATAREYRRVLDAIEQHGLESGISVKPSALGAEMDRELAAANLRTVVELAAQHGRFVRIDMEHSGLTDLTLDLYRELRAAGHENVGIVLQAYLRRSLADVRALEPLRPDVRLVKGIYLEPSRIAYRDGDLVNRNFGLLLERLVETGSRVAVATHDERLIWEAQRLVDRHRLGPDRHEFQMLLGVREELRDAVLAAGSPVRVYVPFGGAWYAYSLRRLKENPSIAGYVTNDVLRSVLGGVRGTR